MLMLSSCEDDDLTVKYNHGFINNDYKENFRKRNFISQIDFTDFKLPLIESEAQTVFLKDCEIYDDINQEVWKYNILLPKSYYTNRNQKYPVLYLLHGLGASKDTWCFEIYGAKECLDYCRFQNMIEDIIVVMPEGGRTYYVNNFQEGVRYEDFFINIFLPNIERTYKIDGSNNLRFIAGNSMGGYGASYYSIKYPEKFGLCFSISGAVEGKDHLQTPSIQELLTDNLKKRRDFPYFVNLIGYDDPFFYINQELNEYMTTNEIPHRFIEREGRHNSKFFKESIFMVYSIIGEYLDVMKRK